MMAGKSYFQHEGRFKELVFSLSRVHRNPDVLLNIYQIVTWS